MFFFYGRKKLLARRYDAPAFPLIVEPFAGSAAYSVFHLGSVERALLIEKDARVVDLWWRLLGMRAEEVLALPVPRAGEETDDFLHMTAAASNAIGHSRRMTVTSRMEARIGAMLRGIAQVLPEAATKVEVVQGDYRDSPDVEATWFIDPPYQATRGTHRGQGLGYAPGCTSKEVDYAELADWCRSRRGQVIVCEQEGADWLPFRPLRAGRDSLGTCRHEVVWTSPGYGVSTPEISEAACRMIGALGRRLSREEELPLLVEIEGALRRAWQDAVAEMRAAGISDGQIGARLGVSKQAVQQRWPRRQG